MISPACITMKTVGEAWWKWDRSKEEQTICWSRGVNVYPSQIEEAFSHVKGVVPNYYPDTHWKEQMCAALDIDVEIEMNGWKNRKYWSVPMIILILSETLEKRDRKRNKKRVGITTKVKKFTIIGQLTQV